MANSFFHNSIDSDDNLLLKNSFLRFDKDNKQYLNEENFKDFIKEIITGISSSESHEFFVIFDENGDGRIDFSEFESLWNKWLKKLLKPVTALLVIDVQNDFIDGSLAIRNCPARQEGYEVVPVINKLLGESNFHTVVYSIDYHPENHISFYGNHTLYPLSNDFKGNISDVKMFDSVVFAEPVKFKQVLWPKHCIQGTWGAELHSELNIVKDAIFIHKGKKSDIESYSAFWDNMKLNSTELHKELQKRGVTHVFVCGLALDFCVALTVLSALELRYASVLIEDASRGTDNENQANMINKIKSNFGVISNSNQLNDLITGKYIPVEFAKVFVNYVNDSKL